MLNTDNKLTAFADRNADRELIEAIAEEIGIAVIFGEPETTQGNPVLLLDKDGLSLAGDGLIMRGDFTRMLPRLKQNNLRNELLVRAAKIKRTDKTPTVIDATAGMGEDSLLLAAAGFDVTLYERDRVIAALLKDTLRRAAETPELADIAARMTFVEGDSLKAMADISTAPDVIFLDPMFPERQKSALVKKKFQLLHYLEQPCSDEHEMLQAAISAHPHKIVIKRPPKGAYLDSAKPSYSIQGKGIRFDCLVFA